MKRYFEDASDVESYSRFRPSYGDDVFKSIFDYLAAKISPEKWHLAVDVGCGSGQATRMLQSHFSQVRGVDVSEKQIQKANTDTEKAPNISYSVGPAESLSDVDASVDLITSAAAAHWFDQARYVAEVSRVLRNDGCVAIFSYSASRLALSEREAAVNEIILEHYEKLTELGFWDNVRIDPVSGQKIRVKHRDSRNQTIDACEIYMKRLVDDKQRPAFTDIQRVKLDTRRHWSLHDYIMSLRTWSAFCQFQRQEQDEAESYMTAFSTRLRTLITGEASGNDESIPVVVVYDIVILLARRVRYN